MNEGTAEGEAERARRINARIDTTRPNPARVYDVFLGGKDNYPVDRIAAKAALKANPRGYLNVWHNRDFVRRAVSHVAVEAGVRQFLDVGTGLPTAENVHEIAQRIAPQSRIVYVDNDPVVLAHARALLTSSPEGATDYLDADLGDAEVIIRQAARTLDLDQPTALVLAAVLHFVDDEAARDAVARLIDALAPGSYLILSHLTADLNPENGMRVAKTYADSGMTFVLRSRDDILRFVTDNGLEPVEPGIVPVHRWRPDHRPWALSRHQSIEPDLFQYLDDIEKITYSDINDVTDADVNVFGVLARKP